VVSALNLYQNAFPAVMLKHDVDLKCLSGGSAVAGRQKESAPP